MNSAAGNVNITYSKLIALIGCRLIFFQVGMITGGIMMKRKGFTLVELLIVIAIIAALAVMMMMANAGAVADAEVSAIMGNLRSLKTAALSEYFRSKDYYDTVDTVAPQVDLIFAQLGTRTMKGYTVSGDEDDQSIWYAVYMGNPTKEIAEKLLEKSDVMGFFRVREGDPTTEGISTATIEDFDAPAAANEVIGIKIK